MGWGRRSLSVKSAMKTGSVPCEAEVASLEWLLRG